MDRATSAHIDTQKYCIALVAILFHQGLQTVVNDDKRMQKRAYIINQSVFFCKTMKLCFTAFNNRRYINLI